MDNTAQQQHPLVTPPPPLPTSLLHLSRQHHAPLFHPLGKTSRRDVDKVAELQF